MVRMLVLMLVCLFLAGCGSGSGRANADGPPPTIDATTDETFSDSTDAVRLALPNYERGAFSRALMSLAKPWKSTTPGPVSPAEQCKHLHGMTGAEVLQLAAKPKATKRK